MSHVTSLEAERSGLKRTPPAAGWQARVKVGEEPGDEYGAPISWPDYFHACEGVEAADMDRVAALAVAGEVVLGGGAAPLVSVVRVA